MNRLAHEAPRALWRLAQKYLGNFLYEAIADLLACLGLLICSVCLYIGLIVSAWNAGLGHPQRALGSGYQILKGGLSMLPDIVQLAIGALVTYLVVNGLKSLGEVFHRDLSGNAALLAVALTAIVVFAANTLLALVVQIDPTMQAQIDAVLQILVIVLGAFGFKRTEQQIAAGIAAAVAKALAAAAK